MGAAGYQEDPSTGRDDAQAPSWAGDHFAMVGVEGAGREHDVLLVCTLHRPPHIVYVDWRDPSVRWCMDLGRQTKQPHERTSRQAPGSTSGGMAGLDAEQLHELIASATAEGFRRGFEQGRAERGT